MYLQISSANCNVHLGSIGDSATGGGMAREVETAQGESVSRRELLARSTAVLSSLAACVAIPSTLLGVTPTRNFLRTNRSTLEARTAFESDDPRFKTDVSAAAPPATPAEALLALESGNQRFIQGRSLAPHRDLARLREIAPKQAPFAAFLGCADSRVPVEIVFDQGFGDLFVSRIAGNIAVAEQIASLEFGTAVLGAKVLYVLGHTGCGAVAAAMAGSDVPGQISALYYHIRPAVRSAAGNLDAAIVQNVRNQAMSLRDGSTVISKLVRTGALLVVGGVYDLNTGRVTRVALEV
jgi:carbonic anhydrase